MGYLLVKMDRGNERMDKEGERDRKEAMGWLGERGREMFSIF